MMKTAILALLIAPVLTVLPAVGRAQPVSQPHTASQLTAEGRCGARVLPANADTLDRLMTAKMEEFHVPGMSVAIVERGVIRALRTYGWADLEHCVRADDSTLFGIGSISKQFAAAGALVLVRQGRLSLSDSITHWLPEGTGVWDGITVRHLLTHTSGIPDYAGDDSKYSTISLDRGSSPVTGELMRRIAAAPLNFRPGDDWAYSNTAFMVLSVLVERVSGMPFAEYMRDNVFRPLGMMRTRYYSPTELMADRATPYHTDCAGAVTHGPFISDQFSHWGDMGMLSTAHDMGRWSIAMDSLLLLSPELWNQMWSPVQLNEGWIYPYGFGLFLDDVNGQTIVSHPGTFRVGYSAMFERFPKSELTVTVLSNHYGCRFEAGDLNEEVVRSLDPKLAVEQLPEQTDPQPRLTGALLLALQGSDEEHGAVHATPAVHTLELRELPGRSAPTDLKFLKCNSTHRDNLGALGTPVVRECLYRAYPDRRLFVFFLTGRGELAGVARW